MEIIGNIIRDVGVWLCRQSLPGDYLLVGGLVFLVAVFVYAWYVVTKNY